MLGRRHRNSVTEEGGMNTGCTWTEDGKRRQSLQLLFINSSVISIEDAKEPRVVLPLGSVRTENTEMWQENGVGKTLSVTRYEAVCISVCRFTSR